MAGETLSTPSVPDRRSVNELTILRERLDKIDERLLEIIRERLECCIEIALVKRDNDVPMMQPHRIGHVQRRAASYACRHGIDSGFLHRLYELIIAETCRVEDVVIAASPAAAGDLTSAPGS